MLRMAPLMVALTVLLAMSAQAKEAKKEAKAPPAKAKDESCAVCPEDLTKKLEAANAENADLKKQLSAKSTSGSKEQAPYFSAQVIVDSFGSMTSITQAYMPAEGKVGDISKMASGLYETLSVPLSKATPVVSQTVTAATGAIYSAADMAKDLHGKHAAKHTDEYYKATMDAYTVHLEAHVGVARKAYYDNVHVHVGKASDAVSAGVGAAMEGGKAVAPKFWTLVDMAMQGVSAATSGAVGKQLAFLVAPQTFTVFGRKLDFNHGCVDIVLAAVQGVIALYIAFHILWKLCLKTIVWNIGIKLLGKKVLVGVTSTMVKVSYRLTRLIIAVTWYVVLTIISITFSWLMIAICGGLGVALLHTVETFGKVGLTVGMRLSIGAGVGLLFYLICRCTCCKKRKAKPTNGKTNKTVAKTDSKKLAAPPAKQAGKKK